MNVNTAQDLKRKLSDATMMYVAASDERDQALRERDEARAEALNNQAAANRLERLARGYQTKLSEAVALLRRYQETHAASWGGDACMCDTTARNSHDRLTAQVEALRESVKQLVGVAMWADDHGAANIHPMLRQARAALAMGEDKS